VRGGRVEAEVSPASSGGRSGHRMGGRRVVGEQGTAAEQAEDAAVDLREHLGALAGGASACSRSSGFAPSTITDHPYQLPLGFDVEAYVQDALVVMRAGRSLSTWYSTGPPPPGRGTASGTRARSWRRSGPASSA